MNELKFDKIVKSNLEDITTIEYGIIEGNNTIVFIKSGQNGSIYGYNNKYIKMAKRLNKKYKCTVICSSNPFDGNNPLDNAFTVIEKYTSKFEDYKVYYLGFSNIMMHHLNLVYHQILLLDMIFQQILLGNCLVQRHSIFLVPFLGH